MTRDPVPARELVLERRGRVADRAHLARAARGWVALHEAVVGDTPVELSLTGQLRGLPPMPSPAGSPGQPQRLRLASPVNFVAWGCC